MAKNIIINGKVIDCLHDNLAEDCPEDAIWCRALGDIFWAGVKAGRLTKDDSEIKIEDEQGEE